jgi:hypothetical protein
VPGYYKAPSPDKMKHNNFTGAVAGIGGGCFHYLLQINVDVAFMVKLGEAGITAMVCGAAGIIGKEIVVFIKAKIFPNK